MRDAAEHAIRVGAARRVRRDGLAAPDVRAHLEIVASLDQRPERPA